MYSSVKNLNFRLLNGSGAFDEVHHYHNTLHVLIFHILTADWQLGATHLVKYILQYCNRGHFMTRGQVM